jgi:hypothetical protein
VKPFYLSSETVLPIKTVLPFKRNVCRYSQVEQSLGGACPGAGGGRGKEPEVPRVGRHAPPAAGAGGGRGKEPEVPKEEVTEKEKSKKALRETLKQQVSLQWAMGNPADYGYVAPTADDGETDAEMETEEAEAPREAKAEAEETAAKGRDGAGRADGGLGSSSSGSIVVEEEEEEEEDEEEGRAAAAAFRRLPEESRPKRQPVKPVEWWIAGEGGAGSG